MAAGDADGDAAGEDARTLDLAVRDGRIASGDLILFEAIGGGLTWGACAFRL